MANEIIAANSKVPYMLISQALEPEQASEFNKEVTEIMSYYNIYNNGMKVIAEGTQGDYTPSMLKIKQTSNLINKEARFLYGKKPEFNISHRGVLETLGEDDKKEVSSIQQYIDEVLDKNKIEDTLIKAAKDCFIGKRVAYLVNFNISTGVSIKWLNSTQFYAETFPEDDNTLKKFTAWIPIRQSKALKYKRIWQKEYEVIDGVVFTQEALYDGAGKLIGDEPEWQEIELSVIPAGIIINDGLSGESMGQSDVKEVKDSEHYYSRLFNADMDAERKGMNPIKYFIDMNPATTKKDKLSVSPGSVWDLASDTNIAENTKGQVGMLESTFGYKDALGNTLKRLKALGYEQLDIPDINLEHMTGLMLSGKGLKAIYWGMIVRCEEKFKAWEPALRKLVDVLIEGALKYPETVERYVVDTITPIRYKVDVATAFPLPEDEAEEKANDLNDVTAQTMSKKAYMKKWRVLTDAEVDDELEQMARERELLEESFGHEPFEEVVE